MGLSASSVRRNDKRKKREEISEKNSPQPTMIVARAKSIATTESLTGKEEKLRARVLFAQSYRRIRVEFDRRTNE